MIPVQDPPVACEPEETNCILPGKATFFEKPSAVKFSPQAISLRIISANDAINPDQPPA